MGKRKKEVQLDIGNTFIGVLIIFLVLIIDIYYSDELNKVTRNNGVIVRSYYVNLEEIPEYQGEIYVAVNNNIPFFKESDYILEPFERYSELDTLGRCGAAYANICKETMPKIGETREDISSIRPSGWRQFKYNDEFVYNRCHLIAYCLSNENANRQNLITGTRYFNTEGMLTFENIVLEYIRRNPENHVLYRVTPIFEGTNLLASGVEMEAYSVEDNGASICFNVFVYNVQPGVELNYKTGERIK